MKTIYQKIAMLLFLGFFAQIILFGIFYKHVVTDKVITEVNYQENKRQSIMEQVIDKIQNTINKPKRITNMLHNYSKKYNINLIVKDEKGFVIFSSIAPKKLTTSIAKEGYVKIRGRITYIVHGYFPAKISDSTLNIKDELGRIFIVFIIIMISIIILILIYKAIVNPLKKLSKAVNNINYGNTLIEIPYYLDDEFGLLCRNFEEMGKRLKISEDNQKELIQAMSHDIKTPLTSIIGYSKRLVEKKTKEEKKEEYYQIIYKKATDLKSLLVELDDYSSINSINKYSKEIINCFQFFDKLCIEFKTDLQNKDIKFNYYNYIDPSINILLDAKKVTRVFTNLIDNSIKYAGENCNITAKAMTTKKSVIFEICDNGNGVKEELLDKIFDRFYRVESSRSRENGGTGLGLAICKEIIENHNGSIYAKNLLNGGFSIVINLNLENT
jgi:signal transduction histidine kinase